MTLGLIQSWRHEGIPIRAFKKGPDFIDPAWLKLATGHPARNLDTWMMDAEKVTRSFTFHAIHDGINVMEANRGLHDGEDSRGTHSSAEMAKLLKCPVILVLPAIKVTRTLAAIALGMKMFDSDVNIAGVIVNQLATKRQRAVIERAIEDETGIPVLGMLPRLRNDPLPGRHLGLVTPEEHHAAKSALETAGRLVGENSDLVRLKEVAYNVEVLKGSSTDVTPDITIRSGEFLRIGYFKGSAFTFYYPENLEALEKSGAKLIEVDPFESPELPDLDALYIGGGFPETHAVGLTENVTFRLSVKKAADDGLPIYAECGGLMFLSKALITADGEFEMAGVFKEKIEIKRKPQGHGYQKVFVDHDNPFYPEGTVIRGHEFHYSRLVDEPSEETAFRVERGTGLGAHRDGLIYNNVLASYLHVHAIATPEWAEGIVNAAKEYQKHRNE